MIDEDILRTNLYSYRHEHKGTHDRPQTQARAHAHARTHVHARTRAHTHAHRGREQRRQLSMESMSPFVNTTTNMPNFQKKKKDLSNTKMKPEIQDENHSVLNMRNSLSSGTTLKIQLFQQKTVDPCCDRGNTREQNIEVLGLKKSIRSHRTSLLVKSPYQLSS